MGFRCSSLPRFAALAPVAPVAVQMLPYFQILRCYLQMLRLLILLLQTLRLLILLLLQTLLLYLRAVFADYSALHASILHLETRSRIASRIHGTVHPVLYTEAVIRMVMLAVIAAVDTKLTANKNGN
eukprot:SAG31_NODE_533_length_14371_cov_6.455367_7_plen_127_part_00